MKKYTASLDNTAKILSAIVVVIILGVTVRGIIKLGDRGIYIDMGVLAIFFVFFLYTTKGYILTDDELIIRRLIPILNKSISLSDIQYARILSKDEIKYSVRKFGNGGFLGYYGNYYNGSLGSYKMYATNRDKLILLELSNGQKIVISPDDLDLAAELKKSISR